MNTWQLSHGLDDNKQPGYSIHAVKEPAWVGPVQNFFGFIFGVLTRHIFCCRCPEWAWKVPLGKPKRDEDGYLDNSLAGWLWDKSTGLMAVGWRKQKTVLRLPITHEQAAEIDAQFVKDCDSIWEDDEENDDE